MIEYVNFRVDEIRLKCKELNLGNKSMKYTKSL